MTKTNKNFDEAIDVIVKYIDDESKTITDREDWEDATTQLMEDISEHIFEKLEDFWVNRQ